MKIAKVECTVEFGLDVLVPDDASDSEIDKIAHAAIQKEAGGLSADISHWEITMIFDE